jgi:predicted dehydrogenase
MPEVRTVAVVGCGIGRSHIAEGYAPHPDKFRVVAICDLDPALLAKVGDEFAVPHRTTSFEAVLRMDVDIVDICTPSALHLTQTLAALAAGKQVICEKPLAGSLADVDRLASAEREARGRLLPVYQCRCGNGVRRARRIVEAGIAGTPYLATVETAWKRAAAYYATPWRGRLDTALGGVLATQAIHSHDLMLWLMGPVVSLFAATATRVNPVEVEDCAVASLTFRSGALGSLAATLGSQREISRLRFCFEHVTFESSLAPYAPGDDPWEIIPASDAVAARIAEALDDSQLMPPGFNGLMASYHAALEGNTELPVTLADARQSLELVTALMYSAETGAPVTLPIDAAHPRYHDWRPDKVRR